LPSIPSRLAPRHRACRHERARTVDEKDVALFEGEVLVATVLLDLPFNHVFFTSSPRMGEIVMAAISPV